MRTLTRTRWFLPLFSLGLGLLCLAAFWIGDDLRSGLAALAVMAGAGLVFLLGGRSEMVRGLRGDGRDEYWERIDVHATYLAGLATFGLIIGMCLWEWAHGRDGSPYTQLGALAGVELSRSARPPQASELRSASTPGSFGPRAGSSSRHVHCFGFLSSRKRMSFVPCRNRFDCTLS